eukprot:scaffold74018_cov36-Phaeocystis_antarctica.AAC.2
MFDFVSTCSTSVRVRVVLYRYGFNHWFFDTRCSARSATVRPDVPTDRQQVECDEGGRGVDHSAARWLQPSRWHASQGRAGLARARRVRKRGVTPSRAWSSEMGILWATTSLTVVKHSKGASYPT